MTLMEMARAALGGLSPKEYAAKHPEVHAWFREPSSRWVYCGSAGHSAG